VDKFLVRKRKCCESAADDAETDSDSSDTDSSTNSCECENDDVGASASFIKPSKKDLKKKKKSVAKLPKSWFHFMVHSRGIDLYNSVSLALSASQRTCESLST